MKIIIACEESQAICKAFRELGFEAYSCDLLPCSGGHPEWHFKQDVFETIKGGNLVTQDGGTIFIDSWTFMMGHPPCTFMAESSVQWLSHPDDKSLPFEDRRPHPKYPNRRRDMLESVEFCKSLYNSSVPFVALENPVGLLSSRWRKPDQIIQPYQFGDEATKTTCLWIKGLPKLTHTKIVGKGDRVIFSSGKSHPSWYQEALLNAKTKEERQTLRSKTFPGIAAAIAQQWGDFLIIKELMD